MSTSSHSESRCSYSWWWDSHISPKNSKWLQENLTDMDSKVKSMIKLIEEDADSFARRAEMFYKKRPELMELVEEFYRAYRALAERYNHAAGELRYAHRTIVKAFADQQLPFELVEDSPSKSPAHDYRLTPESTFPVRALFKQEDELLDATDGLADLIKKGGSKNLHEMSNENQNLKYEVSWEAERAGKAELEAREPEKFPFDMRAEKEDVLLKYQQCLAKLMSVEKELKIAKEDSVRLDEKAVRAEIEVEALKEALIELEAEKKAGFVNHKEYLDKISNLEKGLKKLAIEAESEARTLKDEISKLELAKETVFNQYKKCLGNIAVLENIVSVIGNEAKLLKKKAEKAENEVFGLKKSLDDTNKEKEATAIQHKCCLEKMSELEREILGAKEDVKHFNNDMMIKNLKLKTAEEKCTCLETLNLSLKTEAEKLAKEIATKDQEFTERQVELENLMTRLEDEHFRHSQIEATLQTLQNLHSRTQDDQRALVVELKDVVRKLKGSEADKKFLEDEIRHVHDENRSLSEKNMSSAVSVENMQNEILELSEIKERLDREVSDHVELSNSIQKEILRLKEEINGLNKSYQMIVGQIEAAGLSPKSFGTNIKCLQGENSKLRQQYEKGANENGLLSKKLENMQELFNKNVVSEISVAGMKIKLEKSREEAKALQESYQFVEREKATLVTEKAYLLSQLETITETMQKLLEKNAILEKSLSTARVELEGLREKSKGLEEICELLKYERSFLLTERGTLASKLEIMEKRLKSVERRYNVLEKRYAELEKQKKAVHCQFEELKVSLSVEKQERMKSQLQSENKLAALKDKIHFLQEENSKKKNEFEEELEKSLKAQFEISILQKFIKDVEEKKYSFVIECQKHVDASKLAEKLIFELESESLEQQVESELLLDEIEQMRLGVYQIFKTLEPGPDCQDKIENEQTLVHRVLGNIEDLKCNVRKHEDEKQLLLVENSVLLTLLEQLESKGMEIELQKVFLENEYKTMGEKLEMAKNEKDKLLEFNGKLKSDVNESNHHVAILEAEMEDLCIKQVGLRKGYVALEEMYLHVNCDNEILMKKFCDLKEEKCFLDQHNEAVLMEYLATANQSAVLCDFGKEKIKELNLLLEALNKQHEINSALELEMSVLMKKMELQKAEILLLNDCVDKLEREMQGMKEYNDLMKKDIVSVKECLLEKEGKLLDTEVKLGAAENLNLKLCLAVDELENDVQSSMRIKENLENNILELSEKNFIQQMEIEGLSKVKTELESEISQLRDEINEKTIREQILSSKLQEKNNEFELWEAGASFYFDLQISSVEEILFQHKLRELSGLCRILQDENASKTSEIEELKGKICSMESEISGLNSQIYAYAPVVAALTDDISSLEHTALVQTKLKSSCIHELESSEADADPRRSTSEILPEDHSIVSLQNLRTRIKAFGKLMEEKMNKPTLHRRLSSKKHNEHSTDETEHSKPIGCLGRDKHDTPKIQKIKTKPSSEPKNELILMKDIPLDRISNINVSPKRLRKRANSRADEQMLELLWDNKRGVTIGESLRMSYKLTEKDIVYDQLETAIKRYSDPPSTDSKFGIDKLEFLPRKSTENERRILERLSSDAAKLENLQMTVQILRENLATNKKSWKSKNVDFETVQEQLLEAEDTVEYLVDLNGQLVRNIENCPSPDRKSSSKLKEAVRIRRRKVSEQARKGSERIGRLQLELQKIQYILMKMEEEKKNKGKNMFFRSRSVVLRDFIYNGRKNSGKRKKGPLCGCFRPSNSRN